MRGDGERGRLFQKETSGKDCALRHLKKDLNGVAEQAMWIVGRGKGKCKSPEARSCFLGLKHSTKASMARKEQGEP